VRDAPHDDAPAAEWDRELLADLAAKCAGLRETEVVGVRGLAAAHETRLLGDIAQVLPVAIATRRSDRDQRLKGSWRDDSAGGVFTSPLKALLPPALLFGNRYKRPAVLGFAEKGKPMNNLMNLFSVSKNYNLREHFASSTRPSHEEAGARCSSA